jgi:hypothetical protein
MKVLCNNCKKIFELYNGEYNRKIKTGKGGKNFYCSITCSNVGKKKKRIILKSFCKKCGNEFKQEIKENKKGFIKKFCSRKCANGRIHSDIWKKNIGVGVKNSKKFYTTISSIEYRNKKSDAGKRSYLNGKLIYGGRTKWIEIDTSNGKIKVQGSYEKRMVDILEKWKISGKIYDWKYPGDRFKYIGEDKKIHIYIIDFKIFENKNNFYYIETKGFEKKNDKLKWECVRQKGNRLDVLFKKDIEKLELKIKK